MKSILLILLSITIGTTMAQEPIPQPFDLTPEWKGTIKSIIPETLKNQTNKQYKLLLFTLSTGYQHWVIPHTTAMLEALAEETDAFDLVVSDDIRMFSSDSLAQFDGIILNNNCPKDPKRNTFLDVLGDDKLKEAQVLENSLLDFVGNGGGIAAIHGGIILLNESEEFSNMMGGSFDFHPSGSKLCWKWWIPTIR